MGLLETAAATLVDGERRINAAARNVNNVNTPGYKREATFSQILATTSIPASPALLKVCTPVTPDDVVNVVVEPASLKTKVVVPPCTSVLNVSRPSPSQMKLSIASPCALRWSNRPA